MIHFTKGATHEEAFERLRTIVNQGKLLGSVERIRGQHGCVCFTEAPLCSLQHGFVNPTAYSRYSPFGVIFDKKHIFSLGGRPVIYQPEEEYDHLPDSHKWRHVRYDPLADPPIDFTWEREWRLKCNELALEPSQAGLVVPSAIWAERLESEHGVVQDFMVLQYSQIMDELLAEQYRDRFPWRIIVLE